MKIMTACPAPIVAATVLLLLSASGCGRISRALDTFREEAPASDAADVPVIDMPGGRVHAVSGSDLPGLVAQRDRLVVVDFYADWCGPCKMLAPVLERSAVAHASNVLFVKVDTDKNRQVVSDYGIRGIPDVRFFLNGREVHQFSGFRPEQEISSLVVKHSRGLPPWEPPASGATASKPTANTATPPAADEKEGAEDEQGWLGKLREKMAARMPGAINEEEAKAAAEAEAAALEASQPIRPIKGEPWMPAGMQRREKGSAPPSSSGPTDADANARE